MDWVRYVLALAVIIAHINELAGFAIPFPITSFEAVGGFFALSGFLMYPNYVRHGSLLRYTRQRARRILPPYLFIVALAAVALVAVSRLGAGSYFSSPGFWKYLAANATFLNWLHPELPGVFEGEGFVTPAVNGSLWTMKVEWCLYFSVPLFIWLLRVLRRSDPRLPAVAVVVLSIGYRLLFHHLYLSTGKEIYSILGRQILGQLAYFYCGMLVYFFREVFRRHLGLFVAAGLALQLVAWLSPELRIVLSPIALSMLVMALSLLPRDPVRLRHSNNISYEMYLFHYPLIQLSVATGVADGPAWRGLLCVTGATVLLSLAFNTLWRRWGRRRRRIIK